ncbi:MAG: hypothetical protein V1729_01910 [Candidatus Woesearchaeota archaeon]
MMYEKSNLCQLGWVSCMGCCGHKFKSKLHVAQGIEKNTKEFNSHVQRGKPMKEFMNRTKDVRECGICANMTYDVKTDAIYCPLHPEVNQGVDLRIDHPYCDILHVCTTAYFYDLWDAERKKEFIKFLKKKRRDGNLDWYKYSIGMSDDSLLQEFEGLKWD